LTWNVWFTAPEVVNEQEWRNHADEWRESIDADHDSPGGPGTIPRHFDGTPFKASKVALAKKLLSIIFYVIKFYIKKIVLKIAKYAMILAAISYMLPVVLVLIVISVFIYMLMFYI